MLLMTDLSSNNSAPNLAAHWKAGYRILALKATEGAGYTWSRHGALADQWHRMGGLVWHYHFARPGDPDQQARLFTATVKPHLKRGDRIVLDAEIGGVNGQFASAFMDATHTLAPGVIYGGPYFLRDNKITPKYGWALWLAAYTAHVPFIPPGWKTWLAWQYTDRAQVPGVGRADESRVAPSALPLLKRRVLPAPRLSYGMKGVWVSRLQTLLNARIHAGLTVDGVFGNQTRAAVNRVKATRRWHPDGVCDRNVWNYLRSA